MVRRIFRNVDRVCFPETANVRPETSRCDVVTFDCRVRITRHTPEFAEAYPVNDDGTPRRSTSEDIEGLPSLLSMTDLRRRDLDRLRDPVDSLVLQSLEVESARRLINVRKTLAMVHKGLSLAPVLPAEMGDPSMGVRRIFRAPDRSRLAKIMAYFGTYPRLMMTGPAEGTARILQATKNSRMTSVYGILRGLD